MKLAICLYKYFPYGGLQRDFYRIADALKQRGHTVFAYAASWIGAQHPEIPVRIIPTSGWQNHSRYRAFYENLYPILAKEHFDLIIGFNKMPHLDIYYAADVCYQARIMQQRSFLSRLTPRYRQYVAAEKAVFAAESTTEILLLSPLQQKEYTHYYHTQSDRFHLLPPGIAKDRIAPTNANEIRAHLRAAYQLKNEDLLLLMVGSGFKTKGLDRTLHALVALPPALLARSRLFVIGDDDSAPFQKLIQTLSLMDKVTFLGGRDDVPHFLLAADLLLHPSYHENTGTVLLEALASGLPVLTVETCGYAHYIAEAEAGQVLPAPFQQSALNRALQKMLLSDADRALWRQQGVAFASKGDIYRLPEKAAEIIEQIGQKRATSSTS